MYINYLVKIISAIFLTLQSITLHSVAAPSHQPYVTCTLNGQLGNQLFEVATTLAYAWDNQVQPLFPDLKRKDSNIPINRKKIFFRLDVSPLPRPPQSVFIQNIPFTRVEIPYRPDQKLHGFFQSWQYFDHHRERIIETFSASQEELDHINSMHKKLLQHSCSVGVHVRTFNKALHKLAIPFVGLDYYEAAMNIFPPESQFVVFSDRINWCKHHFDNLNRDIVYIEYQDHVDDLFLMSMLKHNIIGNSTFSWWAAYMNQNPDKIIVTPSLFWLPQQVQDGTEPNANMPGWVVIDINPFAPYPYDMLFYDQRSTSIDTQ